MYSETSLASRTLRFFFSLNLAHGKSKRVWRTPVELSVLASSSFCWVSNHQSMGHQRVVVVLNKQAL